MKWGNIVNVTLHDGEAQLRASFAVPTNAFGQLPSVLVDPRDTRGRVHSGLWLGRSRNDGADAPAYRRVCPEADGASSVEHGPTTPEHSSCTIQR